MSWKDNVFPGVDFDDDEKPCRPIPVSITLEDGTEMSLLRKDYYDNCMDILPLQRQFPAYLSGRLVSIWRDSMRTAFVDGSLQPFVIKRSWDWVGDTAYVGDSSATLSLPPRALLKSWMDWEADWLEQQRADAWEAQQPCHSTDSIPAEDAGFEWIEKEYDPEEHFELSAENERDEIESQIEVEVRMTIDEAKEKVAALEAALKLISYQTAEKDEAEEHSELEAEDEYYEALDQIEVEVRMTIDEVKEKVEAIEAALELVSYETFQKKDDYAED